MPTTTTTKFKLPPGQGFYWRGGVIWVQVSVKNNGIVQRASESTKTSNLDEAREYRNRLISKISAGEQPTDKSLKIGPFLDDYLAYLKRENRRSYSVVEKVMNKHVVPVFADMKVHQLKTAVMEQYITDRMAQGAGRTTCNRELSLLRSALRRHMDAIGKLPKFPIDRKAEKQSVNTGGTITPEQFERLNQSLDITIRTMLLFALESGARRGELTVVRWEQLDYSKSVIHLKAGETKSGEARPISFTQAMQEAAQELKAWQVLQGWNCTRLFSQDGTNPIDRDRFHRAFQKACRDTGIYYKDPKGVWVRPITFHDTRRTFISEASAEGFSDSDIMKSTGHKTIDLHMRYNRDTSIVSRMTRERDRKRESEAKGQETALVLAAQEDAERAEILKSLSNISIEKLRMIKRLVE